MVPGLMRNLRFEAIKYTFKCQQENKSSQEKKLPDAQTSTCCLSGLVSIMQEVEMAQTSAERLSGVVGVG
jgi:hypothetical protein